MIRFFVPPELLALIAGCLVFILGLLALKVLRDRGTPLWLRMLVAVLALTSMGAIIQSGADANLWTITANKAGKVELFDGANNALLPNELARSLAVINVRQTAATAAGATVWGIHNPSGTRTVTIKACQVALFADGTAAATIMKYEFIKATGVTTFSGGVTVTPLVKKTGLGAATAVVRVLDTGLTTTGATFGGQGALFQQGRVAPTTTVYIQSLNILEFRSLQSGEIELAQNELFALRQTATSAIGDNVTGYCEFAEK